MTDLAALDPMKVMGGTCETGGWLMSMEEYAGYLRKHYPLRYLRFLNQTMSETMPVS